MKSMDAAYSPPEIRDLGTLRTLTQSDGGALHFAQAPSSMGSPSPSPVTPVTTPVTHTPAPAVTPGSGTLPSSSSGGTPDVPEVNGSNGSGGNPGTNGTAGAPGAGNGGGGTGGGGELGDSLPFTGMNVGPMAALGGALVGAGAAVRRFARRG